jgi:Flp pilus assembly protein TadG
MVGYSNHVMHVSKIRRAILQRGQPGMAALLRDESGTAILEFAFVAPAFIALLTGIFYVALAFLSQQGLETAVEGAGRLFQTGLAQTATVGGNKGMSAADFKNAVCNGVSATSAAGASITIAQMLPPFMTCSDLTMNVVVEPANTSFNNTILQAPAYNCYGSVCNSSGNASAAGNAGSSAISGSQNRIVVVQLFYNWQTVASLFGLNGLSLTSRSGQMTMAATAVVTAEAYSCASGQASC